MVWLSIKRFSVQSCYKYFLQENQNSALETKLKEALEVMWEVKAPSKVKIFTWRLLLDRLPIRVQVIKKSIIPSSEANLCIFCAINDEDTFHFLFQCTFSVFVWQQVYTWLDRAPLVGLDQADHLLKTYNLLKGSPGNNK